MATHNESAIAFTQLHVPGKPLILANVWDAESARAVASLPSCKALATASYAIASAIGELDAELTLADNLASAGSVAAIAKEFGKPFTIDLQDGYGPSLKVAIGGCIDIGAVGINLEDCQKDNSEMYSIETAVERIRTAKEVAAKKGVPDFHINARTDILRHGGTIADAIERGQAYFKAGAQSVFVFGDPVNGIPISDITELSKALGGKINISMNFKEGSPGAKELAETGIARISVGPGLQILAMQHLGRLAQSTFDS